MPLFSFCLYVESCPNCKVSLVGEGTVKVEGNLESVAEDGRIIENDADGADVTLDIKNPDITCQSCGETLDYSYSREK